MLKHLSGSIGTLLWVNDDIGSIRDMARMSANSELLNQFMVSNHCATLHGNMNMFKCLGNKKNNDPAREYRYSGTN